MSPMSTLGQLGEELDAPLLVTNLTNVFYLTGFDSSNAALLVQPGGEATLYTDFRYIETAREVAGVEAQLARRSLMTDLGERLSGRVQFEADVLPYLEWQRLGAGKAKLEPTSGVVDALRAVKSDEEVAALARAARIADRALEALTAETWVGRSERELAWRLRELCHAHGADDQAFDSIVASGGNGSLPHAHPTDHIVERGTLVTVDWGVKVQGYFSDCTRTFSTGGELPDRLREIYEVCLGAQKNAVAGVRAGMTGVEADALARDPIEAAGFGGNFGHGLGHGVGLAVHEGPRLSTESTDTLEVGNAVTIEPGIYLPGVGGVRIEDLAIVREETVEVLTSFPKELIEVG
jgi:Xaa-Pro aminopeptidase